MSQGANRSAVFLEEMGIGPLWRARAQAAAPGLTRVVLAVPDVHAVAATMAPAAMAPVESAPAAAAPVPVPIPVPVPVPVPVPGAVAEPVLEVVREVRPEAVRAPLGVAPAVPEPVPPATPMPVITSTPEPVITSMPEPVVGSMRAPVAVSGLGADESTAWFDDAPLPVAAAPVSAEAIAAMDWDGLKMAIAKCTRCDLCRTRKTVVSARGAAQASMVVVGRSPSRADDKSGQAVSGDAGKLLDNMLLAIELTPQRDVYVTNLLKCRPLDAAGTERPPTADELSACKPYLERELVLTGARAVLGLGGVAVQGVLGETARAARGAVHRLGKVAVVATFHPEDLLRQPAHKARAWADLCLAKDAHAELP